MIHTVIVSPNVQVVSAGSPVPGGTSNIRVSAAERSSSSTLALSAGGVKVSNNAILTHMSAATLQGQPMSVAVRTPTQSPVRIQTSSSLQTQQTTQVQQQQGQQGQTQQQAQQQGGNG